jgi:hypothetical protein
MPAFFNDLDGLKTLSGDEQKNSPLRGNKGRQASGQDERKRIERPGGRVVVI